MKRDLQWDALCISFVKFSLDHVDNSVCFAQKKREGEWISSWGFYMEVKFTLDAS